MDDTLYKATFSNQAMNDLVQGEIRLYAKSAKAALKRAATMVKIPSGCFMFVTEVVEPVVKKVD